MSDYAILILTIVFSALFSGIEIAFVTANRLEIALEHKQGLFSGRILEWLQKRSSSFISSMVIGNNIALVIYGIVIAKIIEPVLYQLYPNYYFVFITDTLFSTLIILVTGEYLPKSIFKNNANELLTFFSPLAFLFYVILFIPTYLMISLARAFISMFQKEKMNINTDAAKFGRVDLDNYIREITENTDREDIDHEIQIFQNALDFSSLKARECMIPRPDIVAVEFNEDIAVLKTLFVETKLSKILVYKESIDHIIGYVHSIELFKSPASIKGILLPIFVVPESMLAKNVLEMFIKRQKSVAIVVDDLGGTAGMLTMEDVVEQIVGDIQDEHDHTEDLVEKQLDENDFIFSARLEIDDLNQKYDLNLPVMEGIETLGGLVMNICEKIPDEGEKISYGDLIFEVLKVSDNKINLIKIHNNRV